MKKIFSPFACILAVLVLNVNSCSDDFLDQPSIGAYDESALNNPEGLSEQLVGVYAQLSGMNSNGANIFQGMLITPWSFLLGSVRGGESLVGTEAGDGSSWEPYAILDIPPSNPFMHGVFHYYYNAISLANNFINNVNNSSLDESVKTEYIAEARFLRAHFYFMLKRVYGNIPWVDENTDDVRVPNTDDQGNYVNIWPQIQADMQYAVDHLPETQSEIARPNVWAAKAYLAKIRLEQKFYDDSTLNLVLDVINNGVTSKGEKYGLMPHYHDNFDIHQENNKEGVFMVSINPTGSTGTAYSNYTSNPENLWISPYHGPGSEHGWGYGCPSQWFVDHFRVNADGLPYLDYYATNPNSVKSNLGLLDSDPFTVDTAAVDPRLDWMVGRRGIPYLDWGVMPGQAWLRDATQTYGGVYIIKKYMYYSADEGTANNHIFNDIDGPVIRFADVLLWAAELEVRVNHDLAAATDYVNTVRARMQDSTGWVMNEAGDAPAANYKIGLYPTFSSESQALDAIFMERTLELGLEGHRYYDILRWGDEYIEKELNGYFEFQGNLISYLNGVRFQPNKSEYCPFGQAAIVNSQVNGVPTLKQNPGY